MKNIIFLDVDGVLNCGLSNDLLCANLLSNFKKIVDHFNCDIVLSSSWRFYSDSLKTLSYSFEEYDIPKWVDITPDSCGERWTEIKEWLDKNVQEKCNVIVLDDDNDADLKENITENVNFSFFQTDFKTGLDDITTKIILDKIFDLIATNS